MYQSRFVEQAQAVQQLLCEDAYECRTKSPKLILFDQFVEIDAEQFEDQTKMLSMNEGIFEPKQVVVIVLVQFAVELQQSYVSRGQKGFQTRRTRSSTETSIML